ncbi:MAG: bifunctional 3-(3-hydroxy-phenyl)propionate/3-hydroxycinnamic acid hydroxylase [Proteobacteria bacterium]|nr:bifunctional 3-(3-hydroxy-phenyl)propionate/3-hydroxycinnamic acid hydroxylase [Pseudomonadota bacterium]
MNARAVDHEVVIVGLGPTGLVLAHALGQRGIDVLVLEREPAFYGNARAVYTDGECLRIFQSLGLADALQADMLEDVPVQMVLADGSCLVSTRNPDRPHGWAASNFFYQPFLETTLADALARHPHVKLLRGRSVVGFEQDADGVDVAHVASRGSGYGRTDDETPSADIPVHVRARFLVGADGGRSFVRTQLGIAMSGRSFPTPWLVVDIKAKNGLDGLRHVPYFSFVCDPECPTVNCVQPQGHHRFEFMLPAGQTREAMEAPDSVRRHLARHVDVERFDVLRQLVYTFNALVAERWRDRRVLLAGDAAHMTPQFIGQGMNAGVRDAHNLGWKLHAVLRGLAAETLLDSYEAERRPHVTAMIREAVRIKDLVSLRSPLGAAVRNVMMRTLVRTPRIGRLFTRGELIPKPVYRRGSYLGLPRRGWRGPEGTLMPQPPVRLPDGRRHRLDDCTGAGFLLLGAGTDPRAHLGSADRAWLDRLGARLATMWRWGDRPQGRDVDPAWPRDLLELEDVTGAWHAWLRRCGVPQGHVLVIRPDRFVFAAVRPARLGDALQRLRAGMGRPASITPPFPQPSEPTPCIASSD